MKGRQSVIKIAFAVSTALAAAATGCRMQSGGSLSAAAGEASLETANRGAVPVDATGTWRMGEPIVTYWAGAMPMTDAAAKQLADGGWNLATLGGRGLPDGGKLVDHFKAQLDALQRHRLRGIVGLGNFLSRDPAAPQTLDNPAAKAELDAIVEGIKGHPALYAYTLRDEPSTKLFPNLARLMRYIEEQDPAHPVYVNLYPMSISGERLGVAGEAGLEAGREYLRQFIETCRPKFFSYDHYHFSVRGDGIDYFLNLKLAREAALKAGIPFVNIVQACSWTAHMRMPTGEEMRWLYYTSLAYGAQGISQYVYCHPGHDGGMAYLDHRRSGDADTGVITVGEPTPLYYYLCRLNREFIAVARELQPLKSLAVYHTGILPKGAEYLPENAPFQLIPPVPQETFPEESVEKLSKEELAARFAEGGATGNRLKGFVIGTFGKDDTATHALVVNLDYRTWSGRGQKRRDEFIKPVLRAISGPGRLEYFDVATSSWINAGDRSVPLDLPPGGGWLVRLAD